MKKVIPLFFFLLILSSCALKKYQRPTTALDLDTKSKIVPESLPLEKGKVCFIQTTRYEDVTPGQNLFVSKLDANFSFHHVFDNLYTGSATSRSTVDTAINSGLLALTALQEATTYRIPGVQYQFVPQTQFTDSTGNLRARMVRTKFDPDLIINLTGLTLKIAGDANNGINEVRLHQPPPRTTGMYSTTVTAGGNYGKVLMDYTSTWEIVNTRENKTKRIQLTGRYVSMYSDRYSMYDELMTSARKAGKEFAALITGNRL